MAVAVRPTRSSALGLPGGAPLRTALLACGIASSVLYGAMNIVGALLYPGYSLASQTISELYAIGAPPRVLVASLMVAMAKRAGLPWDCILGAEIARAYKPTPETYLASCRALDNRKLRHRRFTPVPVFKAPVKNPAG